MEKIDTKNTPIFAIPTKYISVGITEAKWVKMRKNHFKSFLKLYEIVINTETFDFKDS